MHELQSVDDEHMGGWTFQIVYVGSLKSADGNCSKDTRSRSGMAKKRMLDLVPIWRDRGLNKDLKLHVGPSRPT